MSTEVERALQQERDKAIAEKESFAEDLQEAREHLKRTLEDKKQLQREKEQLQREKEQLQREKEQLQERLKEGEAELALPVASPTVAPIEPPRRSIWFLMGSVAGAGLMYVLQYVI